MPLFKKVRPPLPLNETAEANTGSVPDRDSPEFFQIWLQQAIAASVAFTPETYTVLAAMRRPRGHLPATTDSRIASGAGQADYLPEISKSHDKK